MQRKTLAINKFAIFSLALLAVLVFTAGGGQSTPKGSRFGESYFESIKVVTHEGKLVDFYNELVKDKIVVVDFIYTTCTDICPLTTSRFAMVYDKLGDRVGKDIFLYSVSLDPVRDTPEVLNQYAKAYEAGPGWLFLTGEPGELKKLRWKLGERSRKLTDHFAHLALGNDKTGEWEKGSLMSEIDSLVHNILSMDPEFRSVVRDVSTANRKAGTGSGPVDLSKRHRGESLFMKACVTCHTIGEGNRLGPDLAGATERREPEWLLQFIMKPDIMLARKDPIAVKLDQEFSGVRMPNLSIREPDAKDLIDYIEQRSREHKTARSVN